MLTCFRNYVGFEVKLSPRIVRGMNWIVIFLYSFGLSKDQGKFALPTFATKGTNLAVPEANEESDCSTIEDGPKHCGTESNSPFRTQDGSCNNLKHPLWGRANSALTRLLPPDYEDGTHFALIYHKYYITNCFHLFQVFHFPGDHLIM